MRKLLLALLLWPTLALAEKTAADKANTAAAIDLSAQLLQLMFGLLFIIVLIFVLAWLARKVQTSLPVKAGQQGIKLVATQPLGARERLLLVQVGKEQVLLGLTPGTITPLHVLQEPVELENEKDARGEFSKRLLGVLQAGKASKESE